MTGWQSWNSGFLVTGPERGIVSTVFTRFPVESMTLMTIASCGHSACSTLARVDFVCRRCPPLHPTTTFTAMNITIAGNTPAVDRKPCDLIDASWEIGRAHV